MAFAQQESEQITELLLETLRTGRGDTTRAARYLKDNISCFPMPIDSALADEIIADPDITLALP